jgi:predicted porin
MNKKLVAVAIAGLLAAPLAQAQTANVTLYGRANMNMAFVNGGQTSAAAGNTNPTVFRVDSNSSRFGIRGTESLGGGLNAIFQIENGSINMSSTGGVLGGRDTFLGLSGSWGTFKMGFFSAPYDDITIIQGSSTLNTGILSTGSLWAQATQDPSGAINGTTSTGGGFDSRLANSIRYDSPTWSGFSFSGQFATAERSATAGTTPVALPTPTSNIGGLPVGFGQAAGANNNTSGGTSSNSNSQSYIVRYINGPFTGLFGYEYHNNLRGPINANLDDSAWSIAAQWQFSGFNIGGVFEKLDYDATRTTDLTRHYWQINSTINIGANGELYVMYGSAGDGGGSAVNGTKIGQLIKGDNTGANTWQVAYTHALSKRTKLFTGYVKVNNDDLANYSFGGNGYSVRAGASPGGFTAGMWHNF